MNFFVFKFGGTSVGTALRIKELVKLTSDPLPKVVVLSAMSGTTNALIGICESLYRKEQEQAVTKIADLLSVYEKVVAELYETEEGRLRGKELLTHHFQYLQAFTQDLFTSNEEKAILAQGELLSTALFHFYLTEKNIPSVLLPALNFMRMDAKEEPDMTYIEKYLTAEMANSPEARLFVTQGYICRNAFGEIDNLKRGGSDYSASIIGAALQSPEIQIWTDIDGMHNNDPRIVSNTHPVSKLSFDEAAELAYFGAKILHPTCILPAQKKNIPVRLKNTLQPDAEGTLIDQIDSRDGVKAIAAKDGITAISIKSARMLLAYGFLRAVFEIFERHKTPIDMITTSEVAVSVTIDNAKHLPQILSELEQIAQVEVDREQTIICIVGHLPKETAGFACQVMEALKSIPLRMVSYGGSANNISVLVSSKHKNEALLALNNGLFPTY